MKADVCVVAAGLLLALSAPAFGHSPIEGIDSFYAGFLHPLFVPAHVLVILTFGILMGQQGVRSMQPAVIAFLLAVAVGLVVIGLVPDVSVGVWLTIAAVCVGLLVALAQPLPLALNLVLGGLVGLLLGLDSTQAELVGGERLAALLGSGIATYLLVLYAMVFAEYFSRAAWQRIGLRVIGSWSAAASILVATLSLSPAA